MRRTFTSLFRGTLTLTIPGTMLTGCPDDTSATASGSESSSETSDTEDPTTTPDPDSSSSAGSSETVDPDSSTTTEDPTTDTGEQCGNGAIDGDEQCDGDALNDESCETQGFDAGDLACADDCTFDVSACTELTCGDGNIDAGEDCDGDELGVDDCESQGFDAGELACGDDCSFDTSSCVMYSCGSNVIDPRETCDGTDLAGEDCISQGFVAGDLGCNDDCLGFDTSACIANICPNDVIEGAEVCDGDNIPSSCEGQGFDGGVLACVDTCDAYDTSGCYVCGDGEVEGGVEECDGGIGAATCVSLGFEGGNLACADSCTYDTSGCFACGDGVLNGAETCDGSDFASNTACVDAGFVGGSPTCSADCTTVTTDSCFGEHIYCNDSDLPIGPALGVVTQSDIAVAGLGGQITDVDVYMVGTHTWVADVDATVTYVEPNLPVDLVSNACGSPDNFDVTWDDEGAPFSCNAAPPPAISGTMIPPGGDLSSYENIGLDGNGTWRLTITDLANGDGGTLGQFCVQITNASTASDCAFDTALLPVNAHPGNHFGDFDFDGDCNLQVSGGFNNNLIEIDGTTGAVTTRVAAFPGIGAVNGVAYRASDDTTFVATDSTARLFSVAPDDSFVEIMVLPTLMNSISLVPEGFGAFGGQLVGSGLDGQVWIIDPDNASAVALSNLADNILSDVTIDPETNIGYAVTQNGNVRTFDAAGGSALLVAGIFGADGVTVDPGVALYLAEPNTQTVVRVDLGTLAQTSYPGQTFDGGYYTSGILFDSAGTVLTKVSGANIDFVIP